MKGFMIAGDRSGTGKTSVTLAVAGILSEKYCVQTFKVGMDYIDPSYHTAVTGRPCRNLDSFVMETDTIKSIFAEGCEGADIAIVEGVRGLYEGSEATGDEGSSASIAKSLDLNVLLVIDAKSITRSAAAIVKGFQSLDKGVKITGVILNNLHGKSHTKKAVAAVEYYCNLPVIGAIPRTPDLGLRMRHLGLVPYLEGEASLEFRDRISHIKESIGSYIDMDKLLTAASSFINQIPFSRKGSDSFSQLKIGIALDKAFNFYYADLFSLLSSTGTEVTFFKPTEGKLPEADGYIIGGGYPELYLAELEANEVLRSAIQEKAQNGVPFYAECGGLMYLTQEIQLKEGWQNVKNEETFYMCGVFPAKTRMPGRRVVSYVEGVSLKGSIMGEFSFKGHEFHYSEVIPVDELHYTYRLRRGFGIRNGLDGIYIKSVIGSYTHLHPLASKPMFMHSCR